jgi:hypothetical protein
LPGEEAKKDYVSQSTKKMGEVLGFIDKVHDEDKKKGEKTKIVVRVFDPQKKKENADAK